VAVSKYFISAFTGNEYGLACKIVDTNILKGQVLLSLFELIHPRFLPAKAYGFPQEAPA